MPRVAIVAVHGVGSPPKSDTAHAVCDLILQHSTTAATYSTFTESSITVPTSPVIVPPVMGGRAASGGATPEFRTRASTFAQGARDRTHFDPGDVAAIVDLDVAFMRDQLAGYTDASNRPPYHTIELTGFRFEPTTGCRHDLHIYEMYWADLSRVGSGLFRIVGALYQLVLHMAHLGRKTVDLAATAVRNAPNSDLETRRWETLAAAHAWVVRLFTVAVPTSSLLLLASIALFLPDALPPDRRLLVGSTVLSIAIAFGLGARLYFRDHTPNAARRLILSLALLAVVTIAVNFLGSKFTTTVGSFVLGAGAVLVVLTAFVVIVNRYDRSAPGALSWGLTGLLVALVGMMMFAPRFLEAGDPGSKQALRMAALAAFQFSCIIAVVAWGAVCGAALVTAVSAWRLRIVLARGAPRPNESVTRAKRALWTARVTIAVSLFSFIVTLLVGYQSLTVLAWRGRAAINVFPLIAQGKSFPLVARALVPPGTSCPAPAPGARYDSAACAKRFFEALVAQGGTAGLPVALGAAGVSLFLVSWFFILVAITSVRRPKSAVTFAPQIGRWIADGFQWLRNAGSFFVWGLAVALATGFVFAVWAAVSDRSPPLYPGTHTTGKVLAWMAFVTLAGAAGIAAARVRLELIASRARPALGIVLDVDNYLRESPVEATPRAKMAERYTSLLRHIAEKKDAAGQPYFDRLIILSHSQGTVISADVLRFMKLARVQSPDLSRLDVRLLTMGSPLRQLYAVHFPHLYDWIDRTDDYGDGGLRDDETAFEVRDLPGAALVPPSDRVRDSLTGLSPSPRWLGVRQWVNLYTSGDYVGRSIWRSERTPGVWNFERPDEAALGAGRRERCLGDGTHTRYWTSGDVAFELDALISDADSPRPSMED